MKRFFILITLLIVTVTLNAKKLYFDIGMGRSYISANFKDSGYTNQSYDDFKIGLNTRLGYRIDDKFIIVGDVQSIFWDGDVKYSYPTTDDNQFGYGDSFYYNESLVQLYMGIGVIYYPRPDIQVGATIGLPGFIRIQDIGLTYNSQDVGIFQSEGYGSVGFGYDLSIAYDYPLGDFGLLLGLRFYYASGSDFENADIPDDIIYSKWDTYSTGLFVKFRY